jgi:hypothetical protein
MKCFFYFLLKCRQLCVLLSAEDIYRSFAEILIQEKNCRFASVMVETLNTLLLTSSELFPLRRKLKDLNTKVISNDKKNITLFDSIKYIVMLR